MLNSLEQILFLNEQLLEDMPQYRAQARRVSSSKADQRRLLRSLMNLRPPHALSSDYVSVQDALLSREREEKGVVHIEDLSPVPGQSRLILWQGDITRLDADAIVNAANSQLLGCFFPCHNCIDNQIHSAAGSQLREECASLMNKQGHEEPTGQAKITSGYNLPAKHVIHTVGPIISGPLTEQDCQLLASCYRSCLELADREGLRSIAFCSISTGEFHFPKEEAAKIAVRSVLDYLDQGSKLEKIVFDVFGDSSLDIYKALLYP